MTEDNQNDIEMTNRDDAVVDNQPVNDDIEANHESAQNNNTTTANTNVLSHKPLEPLRTDPIKVLEARKRRLDRQAVMSMPEIHFVGQILSGVNLTGDSSEGAFCRWKIEHGKAWQHLGGDLFGQTQVAYCRTRSSEALPFNHPIDVHFAEAGLQGWGAPRITMQSYRMDCHGRRILSGYGFAHLPVSPGPQRVEVHLWRPVGNTPEQELRSFLLDQTPALVSSDPIYETAWRERCRLVTVTAGSVFVDLFVVSRFRKLQGVDQS